MISLPVEAPSVPSADTRSYEDKEEAVCKTRRREKNNQNATEPVRLDGCASSQPDVT